jgi:putative hemolysin
MTGAFAPMLLDDRVDTLAGLLLARIGRLPVVGDHVELGNLIMTVESTIGRRIDRVRLRLDPGPSVDRSVN